MEKRIIWHPEKRKISDLIPWDHNPRIITELGLRNLKSSFDEIGMAQPININTKNEILSGHARWMALKEEDPDQEVMVLVPDRVLTPKQEEAVIIRMNKNIAGAWDMEKLANHYDIDDLMDWGFNEIELGMMKKDIDLVNKGDENDEWVNMPDFEEGSDYIKLIYHFNNEEEREQYCEENEISPDLKKSNQWIIYINKENRE